MQGGIELQTRHREGPRYGYPYAGQRLLPTRSLKSQYSMALAELEKSGAGPGQHRDFMGHGRGKKTQLAGELAEGEAYAGSSAGLIKVIVLAAVVIKPMVGEFLKTLRRISGDK